MGPPDPDGRVGTPPKALMGPDAGSADPTSVQKAHGRLGSPSGNLARGRGGGAFVTHRASWEAKGGGPQDRSGTGGPGSGGMAASGLSSWRITGCRYVTTQRKQEVGKGWREYPGCGAAPAAPPGADPLGTGASPQQWLERELSARKLPRW